MKRILLNEKHLHECKQKYDPKQLFQYDILHLAVPSKCVAVDKLPFRPGHRLHLMINKRWFIVGSIGFCKKIKSSERGSQQYHTMCKIARSIGLDYFVEQVVYNIEHLNVRQLYAMSRSEKNKIPFNASILKSSPQQALFTNMFNSPSTCWLVPFEQTEHSQFSPTPNQDVFLIRPTMKKPNETIPVKLTVHQCAHEHIDPEHFGFVMDRWTELNLRKTKIVTAYAIWKIPNENSYVYVTEWVQDDPNIFLQPSLVVHAFDAMVQYTTITQLCIPTIDWSNFALLNNKIVLNIATLQLHMHVKAEPKSVLEMFQSFIESVCSVSLVTYDTYRKVWDLAGHRQEVLHLLETRNLFEASLVCMASLKTMSYVQE